MVRTVFAMDGKLEKMDEFFARRVEGYDEHMLTDVGGCAAGYKRMAQELVRLLPDGEESLLDLGCGTGLELDEIWKRMPDLRVTGIDMTRAMLDELAKKHPDKELRLICGDYMATELGHDYGAAVSFQTMHHLYPDVKETLYTRIFSALKDGGVYIECDYMCDTDEQEEGFRAELVRLKALQDEGFYHYDIPCTVRHQIQLLERAGFAPVTQVFREENTVMLMARKAGTQ